MCKTVAGKVLSKSTARKTSLHEKLHWPELLNCRSKRVPAGGAKRAVVAHAGAVVGATHAINEKNRTVGCCFRKAKKT